MDLNKFISSMPDGYEINLTLFSIKDEKRKDEKRKGITIKFSVVEKMPKPAHIKDLEILNGLYIIENNEDFAILIDNVHTACVLDMSSIHVLYDRYASGPEMLKFWCDEDGDSVLYTDSVDKAKRWTKVDMYKRLYKSEDLTAAMNRWVPIPIEVLSQLSERVVRITPQVSKTLNMLR